MKTRAWLASEMPKEHLDDFDQPWCWKLINSPLVKEVPFQSRTITRNSTMHSMFNRTLATNDTLRACQAFRLQNERENRTDCLLLASIGSGLDGHPGLAHGGTIATLFDEALALGGLMTLEQGKGFVTAELKLVYKAPLPTPSLVLVRVWVDKHEGRKVWVKGKMEDGHGLIYAMGESLYITLNAKM